MLAGTPWKCIILQQIKYYWVGYLKYPRSIPSQPITPGIEQQYWVIARSEPHYTQTHLYYYCCYLIILQQIIRYLYDTITKSLIIFEWVMLIQSQSEGAISQSRQSEIEFQIPPSIYIPPSTVPLYYVQQLQKHDEESHKLFTANAKAMEDIQHIQDRLESIQRSTQVPQKPPITAEQFQKIQMNSQLAAQIMESEHNKLKKETEILKRDCEKRNLLAKNSNSQRQIDVLNRRILERYSHIEIEQQAISDLRGQIQSVRNEKEIKQSNLDIINQEIRENIAEGLPENSLVDFSSGYNTSISNFINLLHQSNSKNQKLKQQNLKTEYIRSELAEVKSHHEQVLHLNSQRVAKNEETQRLYNNILEQNRNLGVVYQRGHHRLLNDRLGQEREMQDTILHRDQRIIQELSELIRLNGDQYYSEVIELLNRIV